MKRAWEQKRPRACSANSAGFPLSGMTDCLLQKGPGPPLPAYSLSTCAGGITPHSSGVGDGWSYIPSPAIKGPLSQVQICNLTHLNAHLGFVNYLSFMDCAHQFKALVDAIPHTDMSQHQSFCLAALTSSWGLCSSPPPPPPPGNSELARPHEVTRTSTISFVP